MKTTFEVSGVDALKTRGAVAFVLLSGVLVLAGCVARTSPALDHAEFVYARAKARAQMSPNATIEMQQARGALERAHQALDEGASRRTVAHYSYLAEQRVEIARAISDRDEAKKTVAAYNAQGEGVLLSARTREAAEANARAERLSEALATARETDRGLVMTLSDVLFETGRAELKSGAMQNLYQLATFLKNHPDRQVSVEGYTDDVGSPESNRGLSDARAMTVRDFLVRNGVSPDRVRTQGYGEEYPVATNATAAGRQQNRRVDVVIAEPGELIVQAPDAAGRTIPERGGMSDP